MAKGNAEIPQVRLRDIKANPNRQFSIYSIREDKVARLIESINKTGFWKNVIGRRKGNKVEIAYGHHRIEAARRVYKPEDTIPIVIEDLSDADMLDMMIRENAEEYNCPTAAIDDSVRAARDYLKAHPDHARKVLSSEPSEVKRVRVGAPMIAKRTGFSVGTVQSSLERLGWIERGEVDEKALHQMPSAGAADRFAKAVMKQKLSLDNQKVIAERLVKDGRFGEASIVQTVWEFVPKLKKTDSNSAAFLETQLRKATHQINDVIGTLALVTAGLSQPTILGGGPTADDISQQAKENYYQALHRLSDWVEKARKAFEREPLKPLVEVLAIEKHGK